MPNARGGSSRDGSVTSSAPIRTREELMEGTRLRKDDWDTVDPKLWRTPVKEADLADPDTTHLTTYVAKAIQGYTHRNLVDEELFYAFREDFEDWTVPAFKAVDSTFRRELRTVLRQGGVYTGKLQTRIAESLAKTAEPEEMPEWPTDEAEITLFHPASRRYNEGQHSTTTRKTPHCLRGRKYVGWP